MRISSTKTFIAGTIGLMSCLGWLQTSVADTTEFPAGWPTTAELISAVLNGGPPQGQHTAIRWEKPSISVWLLSKRPIDPATSKDIAEELSRTVSLAGKSISLCIMVAGDFDKCRESPKVDVVYINGSVDDLIDLQTYLTIRGNDFSVGKVAPGDFVSPVTASVGKGLRCNGFWVEVEDAENAGEHLGEAVLVNSEQIADTSRYHDCLRTLSYALLGVGPIRGTNGSATTPPVYSDRAIQVLYSQKLSPGAGETELRALINSMRQ